MFHRFFNRASQNIHSFDYILRYSSYFKSIGVLQRLYLLEELRLTRMMRLFPMSVWKKNFFAIGTIGLISTSSFLVYLIILTPKQKIKETLQEYQKIQSTKTDVRFTDLLGIEEFKEELEELVSFMNDRKKYIKSGAFLPKGVLLIGPPGCGKTQLARAVAGEANLPFFQLNASELLQPLMGQSEDKIKKLFQKIRKEKQGAILFIDEIDSMPQRDQMNTHINGVMNQLLTEMDGFAKSENILIIAATNREKALDPALTRSGRFDFKIRIRLPYYESRKEILKYYLKKIKFDEGLNLDIITRQTIGFSPADLKNLVNLAIIRSINCEKFMADKEDFEYAFERIKLGIRSNKAFQDEKILKIIAYKEATKALFSHFNDCLPNVHKLSIISYNQKSKGGSILLREKDQTNQTKIELQKMIQLYISGQQMMKVFFKNDFNNIIVDDYKRGIEIAEKYLNQIAMDEDFSLISMEKKDLSDYMKKETENHVQEMLSFLGKDVRQFIQQHKNLIEKVGEKLLEKEELTREEFVKIIN